MTIESKADRLRKRIVEHTLTGFTNARAAIVFGNTVGQRIYKCLNSNINRGQ